MVWLRAFSTASERTVELDLGGHGRAPQTRACPSSVQWNETLDQIALEEVALARSILGDRDPLPRFEVVPSAGDGTVREIVAMVGCDLVLVPTRRWGAGRRSIRRLRSSLNVDVQPMRAGWGRRAPAGWAGPLPGIASRLPWV